MASKCRKFVPNIFNKTKCQTCFGSKEQHSAEALENNKASRKVSKCGYLFVAPGYDFNNPLDKTRRWQRRFFILYDDGELAYSVDENPDTVPQGTVDMNKCTDVKDASGSTGHTNSMSIITPEKTTYIKGGSKEEIQWWFNILGKLVEENQDPIKARYIIENDNKENIIPTRIELHDNLQELQAIQDVIDIKAMTPEEVATAGEPPKGRFEVEKVKPKDQAFSTYRGVRSMKHGKADKHHAEGLRKSSSLHDLSTEEKESGNLDNSRFLSRSGDRLDSAEASGMYSDSARLLAGYGSNPYATLPRSQSFKVPSGSKPLNNLDSSSNSSIASAPSQASTSEGSSTQRRGSFDEKTLKTTTKPNSASERAKMHRARSASMKSFPTGLTLPKIQSSVGSASVDRLLPRGEAMTSGGQGHLVNENETDEYKMAKSSEMHSVSRSTPPPPSPTRPSAIAGPGTKFELQPTESLLRVTLNLESPDREQKLDEGAGVSSKTHLHDWCKRALKRQHSDLMYMKKGWLIKMGTSEKDWKKHWFVLTGNSLRYYKDAKSEETNTLDGRIDLSSCYDISEVQIQRNYGFKIKTRNGEYILSAMTSGIRSNWMKAIRLCMDLQAGNKSSQSKSSTDLTTPTPVQQTNDDIAIDSASAARETIRTEKKKDFARSARRHFSDVNPGNIGKMFSIKSLTADTSKGLSQSMTSSANSATSSKEPSIEREVKQKQNSQPLATKPGKYDQYWPEVGTGIPFKRFVEGSDSQVAAPVSTTEITVKTGDKSDDEDRKRRAKSPSAKIKERTRAKSPKLHSPPPGHEQESNFSFPTRPEDDKMSVSSDDLDFMDAGEDHIHLDGDDNMTSTMSSAGEGMLVDLLENEVEQLKERLEHTQKELSKSHDSNLDLKTKLQTVVREKDPSQLPASIDSSYTTPLAPNPDLQQMNIMKRQIKETKDTIHRQKTEIDQLKSKLDMSTSKLTGTEKALSEALKDVKQEKDKFLKVTTEFNRKVRTLEGQLKDVTQKMEKYHENSLIKDKENRKLDLELKQNQQKVRDHDREILKLKAVEHEYRQMKEKFDNTEKVIARLNVDLKEKDGELKKMEMAYEEQYENLMQDFTKERDDTESHIEELKNQLLETQKRSSMSEQMADILHEKDEIIAQLEEKVIESEQKMVEITEELKADEEENSELQNNIEIMQEESNNSVAKIKDLELSLTHYKSQGNKMEKENASIRKHMDDLRKENTDLSERFDLEKSDSTNLVEDNESLKANIKDLEGDVKQLHDKLNEVISSQDRHSHSSDGTTSQEMLHTFIVASSEMSDVAECMLSMKKLFEHILTDYDGNQKSQLVSCAEAIEDIGGKCGNISEILKEGSSGSFDKTEKIEKQKTSNLESSVKTDETEKLKKEKKDLKLEADKWKKEASEMNSKMAKLKAEDVEMKQNLKHVDEQYQNNIESLSKRVEEMASKNNVKVEKKSVKGTKKNKKSRDSIAVSEDIAEQLSELEEKIGMVEKVLQSQDLTTSSTETGNQTETEDETETDSDDSEDYTDSEEEDEETDTQDDSAATEAPEGLLGKLKEMKRQLETTNNRMKDLTCGIADQSSSSGVSSDNAVEGELRHTLIKCGEKIDGLAVRLSDGLRCAQTETPRFSDNIWAFQKCVNKLKNRVGEVSALVHDHDDLNAKDMKKLQEKLRYLVEYVSQVDKLGETDWDMAGKIAKQEMKFQHLLSHKEKATRKSTLKYEDRLQLYADKLAFEAMILGQMAILIQRQQVGNVYKDSLMREIHEANLNILELERRIDSTSREINPSEQEKDLVSSYASMLAEKIVLEGHLASCAMVQELESSQNVEVLSALNVNESPTVLAMEIFLRSQVDTSVNEQIQKFSESMDSVSSHIVTRALLQGEITHALKVVKQKFRANEPTEDISSLVKRERQFAYEQLELRHSLVLDLVNETEPLVMTTLIQLIEFNKGPNTPNLDTVCDRMTGIVHQKMDDYEKLLETADSNAKIKIQHILSHLATELEDAISIFREEYHCYVQTASPDIDPNILKFSTETICAELAGMFIQKAVIDGTFEYVSEICENAPEVPVNQMMDPLVQAGDGLSDLAKSLGQILLTEAANKQSLSAEVRNVSAGNIDNLTQSITDLVSVIPDLEAYPQSFNAYAVTLVREAMFQSQLTYTTYKLKLQYHRELRDIKLKMEAGEKVILPSEISREAESDIQASMTIFEEILNTKYQDECAVLDNLESEIAKLRSSAGDKSCSRCKAFESNLKQFEKTFQHETSVAQERQNVHIDVLRQEVNNVILRVDKFLEDQENVKESLIADYEDRILTLQDEFDLMRVDHEEELEQVKQDIMTAVSAIKATEDDADVTSTDTLKQHNKQLLKMSLMCKELLNEIRNSMGEAGKGELLQSKIDEQMACIMQFEYDPSFTLDISLPITSPDSPKSPPTLLLTAELPPKLDRSLTAEMSDENVDKLLERSQHEHEMEQLKKEKEAALADEIKVTKAALDAMRKAYEEELEQEKEKYRHALKTMCTDDYVEDIRRRHDVDIEKVSEELKQISMHYESKCEDYKLLEDRLSRTKTEYQTHINHLNKSNEHLTELVNNEIEQLKEFIQTRSKGILTGSSTLEEELYDSQIMVRVKDAELQKLRTQVKNLENSLERMTEEQRYTMTQYLQCYKKSQELQKTLKDEVTTKKERRESITTPQQEDQIAKSARALRRNPSFHQRARSPSPETSPRKDQNSTEHHSRDTHRRSRGHLSAQDLKRSKSSPSLPFVFDTRGVPTTTNLGLPSTRGGQTSSTVNRRESGKYSKSPKK